MHRLTSAAWDLNKQSLVVYKSRAETFYRLNNIICYLKLKKTTPVSINESVQVYNICSFGTTCVYKQINSICFACIELLVYCMCVCAHFIVGEQSIHLRLQRRSEMAPDPMNVA